jgi:hypothetical protein
MKRRLFVLVLLANLLGLSIMPSYAQNSPDITSFTTSFSTIGRQALQNRSARIPVSWTTVNRPLTANLVFEQVFADGSSINVELPRLIPWVNSTGDGVAAPILPAGSPTNIVLRVSLISLFNATVLDRAEITIPIVDGNGGGTGTGLISTITVFTANTPAIDPAQLRNGTVRIPVSWTVINRQSTSQLYFEQVLSNGTAINVELPRPFSWVNSSDSGIVAPVADGNASSINLRLRLVDLLFNRVLDQRLITVPIQSTGTAPQITSFTSSTGSITSATLQAGTARIPVSWNVSNRPNNSNLVFEQVLPNGTTRNAELPRDVLIVPSTGNGTVAPIMPTGNPSQLVFQLRLVDLASSQTLVTARLDILISYSSTGYTTVTGDACYRAPFAPSQGVQVGGTARVQLFSDGAHITIWNDPVEMSQIVGELTTGTSFTITDAPRCYYYSDNETQQSRRRWPVDANGTRGWVDEYWGDPLNGFSYAFLPATSTDIPRVDIVSFSISPTSVDAAAMNTTYVTFRWQTSNANRIIISGLSGAAYENLPGTGEVRVLARDLGAIMNPTVYTLMAYDSQHNSDTMEASLSFTSSVSINSFTITPTTMRANTSVTLNWDIRGDFETAHIWWSPSEARPELSTLTQVTSNTGSYSFTIPDSIAGQRQISLTVTDESGTAQMMNLTITISCAYDWGIGLGDSDCPRHAIASRTAAYQSFQRGFMVWLPIDNQSLWVFYNDGTVTRFVDYWNNTAYTIEPAAPDGLIAPERGFGYLWNSTPEVRSGLGWATGAEQSYNAQFQETLSQGKYDDYRWYLTLPDGRTIKVTYTSMVSGLRWE